MSTYYLKLLTFASKNDPVYKAYIAIKDPKNRKVPCRNKPSDEEYAISPDCVSIVEFRSQVELLINELKTIEKDAEKFFAKEINMKKSSR